MFPTARRRLPSPRLLGALLAAAALAVAGCGDDGGGEADETPEVAQGELIEGPRLERCLRKAGIGTGVPGSDAVLASYAEDAVAEGGASFVVERPIAHVIVFPDRVDLERAEQELRRAALRDELRAEGLQADVYGNVLVAYFSPQGADKAAVTECLGADAEPVSGFAAPFRPTELTPEVPQT